MQVDNVIFNKFVILLTSVVICKQRLLNGKGLCIIFKSANAVTLAKTILENPHKILQGLRKGTIFTRFVQFSKTVHF